MRVWVASAVRDCESLVWEVAMEVLRVAILFAKSEGGIDGSVLHGQRREWTCG